jgi:hypothetical protein
VTVVDTPLHVAINVQIVRKNTMKDSRQERPCRHDNDNDIIPKTRRKSIRWCVDNEHRNGQINFEYVLKELSNNHSAKQRR